MKFGIGAIFKDEFDYILEWLAWHRLAGFSHFFIADNGSTDGTRQLLEALAEIGLIHLFYVPPQRLAQGLAYKLISKKWGAKVDAILFIDADEFIFADDGKKPVEHLERLFSEPTVGAVGINWRVFGSSGKLKQERGLVVERFLNCAKDDSAVNRHIKSVVRTVFLENIPSVHYFDIPNNFSYLDGAGGELIFTDHSGQPKSIPMPFGQLVKSPLRINHYVIKSFQEYTEKKRKRGDAIRDPNHDRGHQFFVNHDLNDVEYPEMSFLSNDISKEIENIKSELRQKSIFYENCNADFHCDPNHISGWAALDIEKPKIMLFVNGILQAELEAYHYRPDIMDATISKDGYCGFHHVFTPILKIGDVVNISIYSNPFRFTNNPVTIGSCNMNQELINKGFKVIGHNAVRSKSPIIVIGAARGGTSMVAGILAKLGVFMGDQASAPVYEDIRLATALEAHDIQGAKKIVAEYNHRKLIWSYKHPSSINQLDLIDAIFESPRYLFVYKDIFSIANRNAVSMLSDDLMTNMGQTITQYQNTLTFISDKKPDAMLFSYDKVIAYKADFIQCLIEFCQLEVSNDAIKFIDTESNDYLDKSPITKGEGRIDGARGNVISGWGRYVHQKKPAQLDIFINDVWIGEVIAQNYRPDLEKVFGQACAFSYVIKNGHMLKAGDKVRARVKHEVRDINNSPFIVE